MKKKRLISVFLIVINLLLSCNMVSLASTNVSNDEADLLIHLNIISEKFVNKEAVTRGDFAIMIAKTLNTGVESSWQAQENPFEDLYKYEPYSEGFQYLKDLGIILGDENNKFHKRDNITVEQAYIIALRALGYDIGRGIKETPAKVAGDLNIKVSKSLTSEILPEDAVHIVYKMLFATTFYDSNLNVKKRDIINGTTFLKYYWDIDEIIGIVNSDGTVSVQNGIYARSGKVLIGINTYNDPDNLAYSLAGYKVKAYVLDDEIRCIQKYRNKELEISSEDLRSYSNYKIYYNNQTIKRYVELSKNFLLTYNGVPATDVSQIIPAEGAIKLIDNDDDGKYDVVNVNEIRYIFVNTVNSEEKIIVDQNDSDFILDLDDYDTNKKIHIFDLNKSNEIAIEDIKEYSVLRCITDEHQTNITAYLTNDSMYGRITQIDNDEMEIGIDGIAYKYNGYYKKYYLSYTVGSEGQFYFADDGTVTAFVINTGTVPTMKYGYIIEASSVNKTIGEDDCRMRLKVLAEDGITKKLYVKEPCIIDGRKEKNIESDEIKDLFFAKNTTTNEVNTKYQLIRYYEENGICSRIDTIGSNNTYKKFGEPINTNDILQPANVRGSRKYKSLNSLFLPTECADSFRLTDSTIVFYVPSTIGTAKEETNYPSEDFQVGRLFKNDQKYIVESYNIDKSGAVGAVVAYQEAKPEVGTTSTYGVIYKVSTSLDEDEDVITKKIVYFDGNRFNDLYLAEEALEDNVVIKEGDVVRFELNARGRINTIKVDYSHERGSVMLTSGEDGAFEITKIVPQYMQDGYILGTSGEKTNVYKIDGVPIISIDESNIKGMKKGTEDSIHTVDSYGKYKSSELILIMSYSAPKLIVAYNVEK